MAVKIATYCVSQSKNSSVIIGAEIIIISYIIFGINNAVNDSKVGIKE